MSKPVQPYRNIDTNEGGTVLVTATFLDKDDVNIVPTTVTYRIDDLTNDREVLGVTTVSTPALSNTITVTPAQNALNGRTQPREIRQVTIKATDSAGAVAKQQFYYTLIRIFTSDDRTI